MSITKNISHVSNRILDRCIYVDTHNKVLSSGDMIFCISDNFSRRVPSKDRLDYNCFIGIYICLYDKNESKIVFKNKHSGKFITRTLHDCDYKRETNNFERPFMLKCSIGDFTHMPEEWKKEYGVEDAILASKQLFKHFDK